MSLESLESWRCRMLSIKRLLILCLSIVAMDLQAQELWRPENIITEIMQKNPVLRSYDFKAEAQDAKVPGAKAWMAPMVGAGTFMTPYPGANVMDESAKGSWMFSLEQEIPNPMKLKARAASLSAQSSISRESKAVTANELRATAKGLFYAMLIDYKKLSFQQQSKAIMITMKKLGEIRYQYNQGMLNAVFKAEGRIAETDNMISMSESSIRSKKIALNALMYRPATAELAIDTAYQVVFKGEMGLDTSYFAGSKSEIKKMDREIAAMQLNIAQMKKEIAPDFKLRFEHMVPRAGMMPNQYTLMGMVSLPIAPWSSGMYKAEVKTMQLESKAMEAQRAGMLSEMTGMGRSMQSELMNMQQQLSTYKGRILPALEKNLRLSMLAYQENKATLDAVIDAWETQNMAQMNYLEQLDKFYRMIIEYEKTIER